MPPRFCPAPEAARCPEVDSKFRQALDASLGLGFNFDMFFMRITCITRVRAAPAELMLILMLYRSATNAVNLFSFFNVSPTLTLRDLYVFKIKNDTDL